MMSGNYLVNILLMIIALVNLVLMISDIDEAGDIHE